MTFLVRQFVLGDELQLDLALNPFPGAGAMLVVLVEKHPCPSGLAVNSIT